MRRNVGSGWAQWWSDVLRGVGEEWHKPVLCCCWTFQVHLLVCFVVFICGGFFCFFVFFFAPYPGVTLSCLQVIKSIKIESVSASEWRGDDSEFLECWSLVVELVQLLCLLSPWWRPIIAGQDGGFENKHTWPREALHNSRNDSVCLFTDSWAASLYCVYKLQREYLRNFDWSITVCLSGLLFTSDPLWLHFLCDDNVSVRDIRVRFTCNTTRHCETAAAFQRFSPGVHWRAEKLQWERWQDEVFVWRLVQTCKRCESTSVFTPEQSFCGAASDQLAAHVVLSVHWKLMMENSQITSFITAFSSHPDVSGWTSWRLFLFHVSLSGWDVVISNVWSGVDFILMYTYSP